MTLAHESGHYIYGVTDDYTQTALPLGWIEVTADPISNKIIVKDTRSQNGVSGKNTEFEDRLSPFTPGTPIIFYPAENLPQGLETFLDYPPNYTYSGEVGLFVDEYATIDQVFWDSPTSYSFTLKDKNKNKVDIRSVGSGLWSFDLPGWNRSRVAHSIMDNQYEVATSYGCSNNGVNGIQWQWANFSTEFNINPYCKQGMEYRNNGKPSSAWDVISRDPMDDYHFGVSPAIPLRYWFKSLAKRKPTASDVFTAKSYMMNYNPATGKVADGHAVWLHDETCGNEKTYDLQYMKVELANQPLYEFRKKTHKYLDIQWDRPEAEVIVLVDNSLSMRVEDKLEKAKLAAKGIAEAYLSASPTYNNSNVSVGVYAFNDNVDKVRSLNTVQSMADVETAIDNITIVGTTTVLFNALYSAIDDFSTNSTSKKILYVITDGKNFTAGAPSRTEEEVKALYRSRNVPIYALAYGRNASRELLSSMSAETDGEYYEGESGIEHDVVASITNVLAAVPGHTQLKAASIIPAQNSGDINLPRRLQRARVYASYDIPSSYSAGSSSGSASSPIELLTQGGASRFSRRPI